MNNRLNKLDEYGFNLQKTNVQGERAQREKNRGYAAVQKNQQQGQEQAHLRFFSHQPTCLQRAKPVTHILRGKR